MSEDLEKSEELYEITPEEEERILRSFFSSREPLKLKQIPARAKRKYVVIRFIANEFTTDRRYTEQEVNQILAGIYPDYAALRRYLIDARFLTRTPDGGQYWRVASS